MHPLNRPSRWLILPGLSAAAGTVAGLALQAVTRGGAGSDVVALGAVLGLASALSVAITPKTWIAVLLAPPLGLLGTAGVTTLMRHPWAPWQALEILLQAPPGLHLMILLTTAPNVVLHGMRMRRKPSWFWTRLLLAIAVGCATGLTLGEAFAGSRVQPFMLFCVLLDAGCAVALEVALRRSARVIS